MRIALIDRKGSFEPSIFDKIVSFYQDNYVTSLGVIKKTLRPLNYVSADDYINEMELATLYESIYSQMYSFLNMQTSNKTFVYKETDLLWAYGRDIFEFIFNLYKKIYIIKKIIEKDKPKELWIPDNMAADNSQNISLDTLIRDVMPHPIILKYLHINSEKKELYSSSGSKKGPFLLRSLTKPLRFMPLLAINAKDSAVLVNSDLEKMFGVLSHINCKKLLFLREDLPEKLIFYFLRKGVLLLLFSDFKPSKAQRDDARRASEHIMNSLEESLNKLYICGLDLTTCLQRYLYTTWRNKLTYLLNLISQIHIIFNRYNIRVLLLDEDRTTINNLLVQVSKIYQCKSYVNCHGEPFLKIGYMPLTADYIFVWGMGQKRLLNEWGLKENRIIVCGSTKHEKYQNMPAQKAKWKVCKEFGFSVKAPIALLGWPALNRRNNILENVTWIKVTTAIKLISKWQDVQIIIKLHPGDIYQTLISDFVAENNICNVRISKDFDPILLVKGADLLIVYGSTFAIDGLAYKKPVILLDKEMMMRYERLNFFYDGTTEENLKNVLNSIISGAAKDHIANWQEAANYCFNGMDGSASKRIAQMLARENL